MPLPILPDGLEAGLRQFMRQSQIGTDVLMQIINEAFGTAAQQPDEDERRPPGSRGAHFAF